MDVDVWWATVRPRAVADHLAVLDAVEQRRYAALRTTEVRQRFVAGRLLLRTAVAERLGVEPGTVPLVTRCTGCGGTDHGKPAVAGSELEVSLSHSADTVVVAVAAGPAVGVDVESLVGQDVAPREALEVLLSAEERRAAPRWADLPVSDTLRWWTRKEAVLKALGHGLTADPDQLVVSTPGEPPSVLAWQGHRDPAITRADLEAGAGAIAALAVLTRAPVRISSRHAG